MSLPNVRHLSPNVFRCLNWFLSEISHVWWVTYKRGSLAALFDFFFDWPIIKHQFHGKTGVQTLLSSNRASFSWSLAHCLLQKGAVVKAGTIHGCSRLIHHTKCSLCPMQGKLQRKAQRRPGCRIAACLLRHMQSGMGLICREEKPL